MRRWSLLLGALGLCLLATHLHGKSGRPAPQPDAGAPDAGATAVAPAPAPVVFTRGRLVLPEVISLPYATAGLGGTHLRVLVQNTGDLPLIDMDWRIEGDAALHLVRAPDRIPGHQFAELEVAFDGSPSPVFAAGTLRVVCLGRPAQTTAVVAVAGDVGLPDVRFEPVLGPGLVPMGFQVTTPMPSSTYPGRPVRIFIPEGYHDRGSQDLVLHFHGYYSLLDSQLDEQKLEAQVWASGANVIFVMPQGPINEASADFGKLMTAEGCRALLDEVLALLYREGKLAQPVLGDVVLSAHSGGFYPVAQVLGRDVLPVRSVLLFDATYDNQSDFADFVARGGVLRANWTVEGSTESGAKKLIELLTDRGLTVRTAATTEALQGPAPVVFESLTTHSHAPRALGGLTEMLRWGMRHHRFGPLVELREASAQGGHATVRWEAPDDEDVIGYRVERPVDGTHWRSVVETSADARSVTFEFHGTSEVRVRSVVHALEPSDEVPSATYALDEDAEVLVVDAFNRWYDGAWSGGPERFAAEIGDAIPGGVATVSRRAVTEDGIDLSAYRAVVWLLGDDSTPGSTLTPDEQLRLRQYVEKGGHLIVSGSDVGLDLVQNLHGADFISWMGALFSGDDADQETVVGVGALAHLAEVSFGGDPALYDGFTPESLLPSPQGQLVLRYPNGKGAAAGIPGRTVLVGFPLETVADLKDRRRLMEALLGFVGAFEED
jgi:hypothetical protein